ncbi:MAG: DNA helicase RecQ [Phycisphaerales bacterium]|nr:DNA helicase RecQ [Phycisphaerales bacterium]
MSATQTHPSIRPLLKQYWGFDRLRPLQAEAIDAGLQRRDSLVVMPTGGGKSLCYQVPPLLANRTDVVVSPLIALMKDQVDALRSNGYPAAAVYSGMTSDDRRTVAANVAAGRLRLLFVSPERLLTPGFLRYLDGPNVRTFAIDEAHCISHWGHDFRPEYRRLAELREHFPDASLHAFTATATERVREDILHQLGLKDPCVLVGSFDRPNLVYRVIPRTDVYSQVADVITRHKGRAVIVYCISRRDTENLAGALQSTGFRAAFYHAGMTPDDRRRTQDDFARERIDIIVATVAFGMGIDRSDVRCVIHAAMPKSVEHYQQESGRAGRDGLEAECVLLYSTADAIKWEGLMRRSAEDARVPVDPAMIDAMLELLRHIRTYAGGMDCRHAALVRYFGQPFDRSNCGACDVCLGEIDGLEDETVLAQKILSCVARVGERFGVGHVVDVLKGADTERIRQLGHDRLSTHALLADMDKDLLKRRVYDLLDQQMVARDGTDKPVLKLNAASWDILRGRRRVMLRKVDERVVQHSRTQVDSWEGVDQGMYDELRALRRTLAEEQNVPAFVIFNDVTLLDLARRRPVTVDHLRTVHGIGKTKAGVFGRRIIAAVQSHCRTHDLLTDVGALEHAVAPAKVHAPSLAERRAFEMFAAGAAIEEVMHDLQRARSTTMKYLVEFIANRAPASIDRWVDAPTYDRVRAAIEKEPSPFLRPVFEALDGQVPYDTLRLVAAHLRSNAKS